MLEHLECTVSVCNIVHLHDTDFRHVLNAFICRVMATDQPPNEHGKKEREMVGIHNMPLIETPWSWYTDHWWSYQSGPCADDEYYFIKCVGHVGVQRAPAECKQLHDDFIECVYRFKTVCLKCFVVLIVIIRRYH